MKYYQLGATLHAKIGESCRSSSTLQAKLDDESLLDVKIQCQDVLKISSDEVPRPSLFWLNPPVSAGSALRWMRRAAKTTHGVEYSPAHLMYEHIFNNIIKESDSFIATFPDVKDIDSFISSLGLEGVQWIRAKHREKPMRIVSRSSVVKLSSKDVFSWDNNADVNFRRLVSDADLSEFKWIVDLCAGKSDLLPIALENKLSYYGVELSSFEAFSRQRLVERIGMVVDYPVSDKKIPDGIVIGAPAIEYNYESSRDFSQGRILSGSLSKQNILRKHSR